MRVLKSFMTFTHKTPNISCLKGFRPGIKILLCSTMLKQRSCGIFSTRFSSSSFSQHVSNVTDFFTASSWFFSSREKLENCLEQIQVSVRRALEGTKRENSTRVAQPQSHRLRLGMLSIEAMQLMLFSTLLRRNSLSDFYVLLQRVVNSRCDSFALPNENHEHRSELR